MELYLIRHGRQSSRLCNVNVDLSPEAAVRLPFLAIGLQTGELRFFIPAA